SRQFHISRKDFPGWLEKHRKNGEVALLLVVKNKSEGVPEYLPEPDVVKQTERCIMIMYKSRGE
ncbi:MAG: hypothetical protein FWH25_02560, partial [Syntrophorhabdaceae bacterium]|nr:hypothetical protein [Syntrophorhabdaceae bacterium]